MKLLTVAVPCYNSQDYMANCIESLLKGGSDVEIVIVNDGSKDDTARIAEEYQERYPDIIKVVHQENGGHGEAVNTGLANASGLYFKVVDSDDWLNEEAFLRVLEVLRECLRGPETLDMLISNYVYEKVGAKNKRVMRYPGTFPEERIFGWDDGEKPVSSDALPDLPYGTAARVWPEAPGAYLLCGQSGGFRAPSPCKTYALCGCESLPVLHRTAGSVRQRAGDDFTGGSAAEDQPYDDRLHGGDEKSS